MADLPIDIKGLLDRGSIKGDYQTFELAFKNGKTFQLPTQEIRRYIAHGASGMLECGVYLDAGRTEVRFSWGMEKSVTFNHDELLKALGGGLPA